jgi:hypothetical protein
MTIPNESEFAAAIEVVAGNPTEEELAAVIAVLAQARTQQESAKQPHRSTWAKNHGILRESLVVGNGQWGSRYKQGL